MNIAQYVGLWTLVNHPSREREWTLLRKLRAIKNAGFQGFTARLDAAIASLAEECGLDAMGLIFADHPADFEALLSVQQQCGARHVNVQLGPAALGPADATKRWIRLESTAARMGLSVSLETHRDSATETPEKILAIADRYEAAVGKPIHFTWDFSQLAIVKHVNSFNLIEKLIERPDLVQHSTVFHFRPFNGHHAQLPVTHRGELTDETRGYLDFVEEIMHLWKIGPANRDRTLIACPELGPRGGYALSTFPPVWPDAVTLSRELAACWKRAR